MRFFRCISVLAVLVFLVASYCIIPASAQEASIVRATQVDGTVTKNGAALNEGDIIQRGDKIASKKKSAVVLTWSNGTMLKLFSNTSIILKGVVFENDRKMEKTFLTLETGRIFAKAQVPEDIFENFELKVNYLPVYAQASEFAVKYSKAKSEFQVWSLIGTTIVGLETDLVRINEGQEVKITAEAIPQTPVPMAKNTLTALTKISNKMGGSMLIEEESAAVGGPLKVKIGGVRNRRGSYPYTVNFKAITRGGSGKIKSINWNFGDGESAADKKVKHTFTQGVYGVVLVVEDENGEKASAQINISVEEDCSC
ncbi:MAG: PKD domain-containing protein [Desulfobacula sp.]|nr:PKD domain-containing protein [Desulfobacula sp.]